MKLATYNVNGIRAALRKGLAEWLAVEQPDVLCLQEIKATPADVDVSALAALGYQIFWHPAVKKGYSGVATLVKAEPRKVQIGLGIETYDSEGRVLIVHLATGESVMNVYMPSGTTGDERQGFKYRWLDDFMPFALQTAAQDKDLFIVGDFNIAHTPQDIHNPVSNKNTSGFLPEERAWMSKFLEAGFVDSYRSLNPEGQEYSWWSQRFPSLRERNLGWRIDYIVATPSLATRLTSARMAKEAVHSDHCPVVVEWC